MYLTVKGRIYIFNEFSFRMAVNGMVVNNVEDVSSKTKYVFQCSVPAIAG